MARLNRAMKTTGGPTELFDNILSELVAFTATASYPGFCLKIRKITYTITADIADLVISNLAANTDVHRELRRCLSVNANTNDCQQDLHLLVYLSGVNSYTSP